MIVNLFSATIAAAKPCPVQLTSMRQSDRSLAMVVIWYAFLIITSLYDLDTILEASQVAEMSEGPAS